MVGWHHQLNDEFEQAPRVGDGQGSLACCSQMGSHRDEHDWVTELISNRTCPNGILEFPSHKVISPSTQLLNTGTSWFSLTPSLSLHSIQYSILEYCPFKYISVNPCQVHPLSSIFTSSSSVYHPCCPEKASLETWFPCDLFHHILHQSVIGAYENLNHTFCPCLASLVMNAYT